MTVPGTAPHEATADVRRRAIVDLAAELFDVQGYDRVTMDNIAAAAGIAKPTLYHYFKNKAQILYCVHETFIDILIQRQEQRLQTGLTPPQLLLEMMADTLELMESHRGHVRVFFEHHRELPEPERSTILSHRDRYNQMVHDVLQSGMDDGYFRHGDVRLASFAIFGMCNWAYQWFQTKGTLRTRQIAYQFWDYIVHGLGVTPQPMDASAGSVPATGT